MVGDVRIPSDRLTLSDIPSPEEGWSDRAVVFAHTLDGYGHVGEGGPGRLWEQVVGPASEAFARKGILPDIPLDDLRATDFYLARADRMGGGYGLEGDELALYLAALGQIRSLIGRRSRAGS